MKNRAPTPYGLVGLAFCLAGSTNAALLFYEDFSGYTAGGASLNGQGGWSSPGNSMTVQSGPFKDGSSAGAAQVTWDGTFIGSNTAGGNFIAPVPVNLPNNQPGTQGFAHITLDAAVTDTFVAGATTWLSYVMFNGHNGAAARHNIAIGAAPITGAGGIEMAGQGIGVGSGGTNQPFAAYWDDDKFISATGAGAGRPFLVVAKIEWSDIGNDTISVARFTEAMISDLGDLSDLTEFHFNNADLSTISANLNPSTFDILSINSEYGWINDIRIATDFTNAITGIPEPSTALLGGLGLLLVLRRRR